MNVIRDNSIANALAAGDTETAVAVWATFRGKSSSQVSFSGRFCLLRLLGNSSV